MVVLSSIAIFCGFCQLRVHSNAINIFAATVVGALFIQDFIAPDWIYRSVNEAYNNGIKALVVCCTVWFVLIFLSAFIIENIRRRICSPIISRLEYIVNLISSR